MDLRSCPQEMLASVLKYTKFETVTRIRKTNKHMDYVATKYRINLPKVDSASFVGYGTPNTTIWLHYKKSDIINGGNDYKHAYKQNIIFDQSNALRELEGIVRKIRSTTFIAFHDSEIDQNVVDFLQRIRFTKLRCFLHFDNCNFFVSLDKITEILTKYRNSQIRIRAENKIMNQPMGTESVILLLLPFVGIGFDAWMGDRRRPPLTDETLRVARKYMPQTFEITTNCPFSLPEIKKTMLYLIDCFELGENKLTSWNFGLLPMDSKEHLQQVIMDLSEIPNTLIKMQQENYAVLTYKGDKLYQNLYEVRLQLRREGFN